MRHIQFIALGSAIGTGLFYGSASAIAAAGPAVILVYLVAGAGVYLVMRALGEMAVREPVAGSFGHYATQYLGPFAGFVTGWTYVFEMIVVALADVTAFGVYMQYWFPESPQWMWVVVIILLVAGINAISVKAYGETEFWLTLVKVGAIVAMVLGGIALLLTGTNLSGGYQSGLGNLIGHDGFTPYGLGGCLAALSVVVFAFGGVENVGITAGEADDPARAIPRAVNSVPVRILLFYVATMIVLMSLLPWTVIDGKSSPFVQIFAALGVPMAAALLNVVVITAAISAINSDTFGAGRMLFGMAEEGHAPAFFTSVTTRGVPWPATTVMCAALAVGAVLNAAIPKDVFVLIASIATFATVWVWLMILSSHIVMRRRISRGDLPESGFRSPGGAIGSWIAVAFMVLVIATLAWNEETRVSFVVGVLWIALLTVVYQVAVRRRATPSDHSSAV
ncbi:amino acid permease [Austwickia sp. TVS 96-490-7B]|uniref:amino acid permease n=1 Tax=Austwickia sp. TVS 96-490-7B TaxID=2830843 RepID=UPI001C575946|nr:amino acid permease [Austwickia sp. TVS 96-490-7B]